ncbi:uncharacterized protein [Littorina saxatilis]|uniref:Uncharacterized protein n=1 Tax=Littorina saxatilis TaxID=31220 RepID=A0AAN9BW14_9CAEN
MLRFLSRIVLIAVSSSVVVPYTAAMLCHLLYGRQPLKPRTLVRSLHPRRVYALSVVIVQKLALCVRYAPLYLHWRQYYLTASRAILLKNLAFGRNNCCLDLHLPVSHRVTSPSNKPAAKPVVMFVYGGAWSSGNKSMYGAVCAQLVQRMDVLVCCPNYSHYPQGCVDDMIQDIVDCVQWIYDNIHDYGGDKDRVMMIGHSSGAHLCTMALLEMLHDQRLHISPFPPDVSAAAGMLFHESHYGRLLSDPGRGGARDPLEDSSGSSESFAVVSENGNGNGESQATSMLSSVGSTSSSMVEVSREDTLPEVSPPPPSTQQTVSQTEESADAHTQQGEGEVRAGGDGSEPVKQSRQDSGEGEEDSGEEEDDNDSIVTVRPKEIERHATLIELARSIKAFVGLAGVYNIGDHYKHEAWRGIEDLSGMAPAMYGPDHFERFSPTTILLSLDAPISLPRMLLVHGTADYVVPITSSQKMAENLARVSADVSLRLIPDCDHYDICFDLMNPSRRYHSSLMTLLLETANSVF